MSEKPQIIQAMHDLGLPVLDVLPVRRSWYVVLDEGRPWQHNYTDTLAQDWDADMPRFLARYRMCQRKAELWREFDFVPWDRRMPMVRMAMELGGEPISVPYPA
jgi:hypothetical protein